MHNSHASTNREKKIAHDYKQMNRQIGQLVKNLRKIAN